MDGGIVAIIIIVSCVIFGFVSCLVGGKPVAFVWGLLLGPFGVVVAAVMRLSDDVNLLRQSIGQLQHKAAAQQPQRVAVQAKPEIPVKPPAQQQAHQTDVPPTPSVFCISCGKEFRIAPTTAPGGTVACPYCKKRQIV